MGVIVQFKLLSTAYISLPSKTSVEVVGPRVFLGNTLTPAFLF